MKKILALLSLFASCICTAFAQDTVKVSGSGPAAQSIIEQPTFIGNLNQYIATHLVYPETSVHGTVYVNFTVDVDGSITVVRILKGVAPALDSAAIRCVRGMPKWKPGMQNGYPIRNQMYLPIKFEMPVIEKSSQNPETPPRVK